MSLSLATAMMPIGVALPSLGVGVLLALRHPRSWGLVGGAFGFVTTGWFTGCALGAHERSGVAVALAVNALIATVVMFAQPRRSSMLRDAVLPLVWLGASVLVLLANDVRLVLVGWVLPPLAAALSLSSTSAREAKSRRLVSLYHGLGSVPLVVAGGLMAWGGARAGVANPWQVEGWNASWLSPMAAGAVFLMVAIAVAVRLGVPPLHSWVPTLSETLPAGTMIALTSVQMAVHVMVNWALAPLPDVVPNASAAVVTIGLVGSAYASVVAASQHRLRRVVAFVTVAQSSALLVGLASGSDVSISGALANAISVAVTSRGLMLAVAAIESRLGIVDVRRFSGVASAAPRLAAVTLVLSLAMVGLPGSLGFVGEDLLLQGLVRDVPWVAGVLVVGTALTGVAVLRAMLKTCFGPAARWTEAVPDLFRRERALVVLMVVLLGFGLFPSRLVEAHHGDLERLRAAARERPFGEAPPARRLPDAERARTPAPDA